MHKKLEIEIHSHTKEEMHTKNGRVGESALKFAKENLLYSALRSYSYLVEDKKSYPVDGKSQVDLDLDIVILSRARFLELKETELKYLEICN